VNKVHGTVHNFGTMLETEKPGAIHFSGHGVTKEEIQAENEKQKHQTLMSDVEISKIYEKGDALVFENQFCEG